MPTLAPARARSSAVARPIPREPPVTIALRPARSITAGGRSSCGHPLPAQRLGVVALRLEDLHQDAVGRRIQVQPGRRLVPAHLVQLAVARDGFPAGELAV